jgi:hypothetical protein
MACNRDIFTFFYFYEFCGCFFLGGGDYGTRAGKLNGKPLWCQGETLRCYFVCELKKYYSNLTLNWVKINSIFPDKLSSFSCVTVRHYRKLGRGRGFWTSDVDITEQTGIVATLWGGEGCLFRISTVNPTILRFCRGFPTSSAKIPEQYLD